MGCEAPSSRLILKIIRADRISLLQFVVGLCATNNYARGSIKVPSPPSTTWYTRDTASADIYVVAPPIKKSAWKDEQPSTLVSGTRSVDNYSTQSWYLTDTHHSHDIRYTIDGSTGVERSLTHDTCPLSFYFHVISTEVKKTTMKVGYTSMEAKKRFHGTFQQLL